MEAGFCTETRRGSRKKNKPVRMLPEPGRLAAAAGREGASAESRDQRRWASSASPPAWGSGKYTVVWGTGALGLSETNCGDTASS